MAYPQGSQIRDLRAEHEKPENSRADADSGSVKLQCLFSIFHLPCLPFTNPELT